MHVCPDPMQISLYCHSPVARSSFKDIKRLQGKRTLALRNQEDDLLTLIETLERMFSASYLH